MLDRAVALGHPGDERIAGHGGLKTARIALIIGFVRLDMLIIRLLDALLGRFRHLGVYLLAQFIAEGFSHPVGDGGVVILSRGIEFVLGTGGAHFLVRVSHLAKIALVGGVIVLPRARLHLGDLFLAKGDAATFGLGCLGRALHGQIHATVSQGGDGRVVQFHAVHLVDLIIIRPLEVEIIDDVGDGHCAAVVFRQHRFVDILHSGAILRKLHERIDADEIAARQGQAQRGDERRESERFPVHKAHPPEKKRTGEMHRPSVILPRIAQARKRFCVALRLKKAQNRLLERLSTICPQIDMVLPQIQPQPAPGTDAAQHDIRRARQHRRVRQGLHGQHVANDAEQFALHAAAQRGSGARPQGTADEGEPVHGIALGEEQRAQAALPRPEHKKAMPGLAGAEQFCIRGVGHSGESMNFQRLAQRQKAPLAIAEQQAFAHARSFRGADDHACPSFLMMS